MGGHRCLLACLRPRVEQQQRLLSGHIFVQARPIEREGCVLRDWDGRPIEARAWEGAGERLGQWQEQNHLS